MAFTGSCVAPNFDYWQIRHLKEIAQKNEKPLIDTIMDSSTLKQIGISQEQVEAVQQHLEIIQKFDPESRFAEVWQAISDLQDSSLTIEATGQQQQEELEEVLDEFRDVSVAQALDHINSHIAFLEERRGKLGEYSDANAGPRPPCPNIHPKNVWMNIRIHFGDGFSGSSEASCFFGSFAFLPFGFGFFCSSPDPCFSCSSSLIRLFSASMIWILSRRRVSSSAAASRCLEVTSASCCAYDHLSAVVTNFIKGSMSTRPLFWGSSNGCVSHL